MYKNAFYSFDFRGKTYSFKNQGSDFKYTVTYTKDNQTILDVLDNGEFTRTINQKEVPLEAKKSHRYKNGLNSVIYFTLLPYKLNDAAVIKEYRGETMIFDQPFDVVQVTFKQEGGGDDPQGYRREEYRRGPRRRDGRHPSQPLASPGRGCGVPL